jgi:integrase
MEAIMEKNRIRLGKQAIEKIQPDPKRRSYYYDTVTPGLELHVNLGGTKVFYLTRRIFNEMGRLRLGRYPTMTPDQARVAVARLNGEIANGLDPRDDVRAGREEHTLAEFFLIYIDRHARPRKRTWKNDEYIFKKYLSPLRNRRLSKLKRRDIERLHSAVGTKAPYQANRVLALTRTVLNKAISWGYLKGDNPAHNIEKFKEISRERFLQAEELPRFFKALGEEPNTSIRDFVLLSLLTGARRGNILSMRWKDLRLNVDDPTWIIPATEAKSGEPIVLPLVSEAHDILSNRLGTATESLFVFPGPGRKGHLVEVKAGWARILKRAGIENLRLHDLRRSLGSWQAKTGASLAIIGKSLGHKNVSTTLVYARLNIDPVREAMTKASKAMLSAGGVSADAKIQDINSKQKRSK